MMDDPTFTELLEHIRKLNAAVAEITAELSTQRADISRIISMINREFDNAAAVARHHDQRLCVLEKQFAQHLDLDGAIVDHSERLCALEGKVFPKLWPTIQRVVSVIGELEDRYDIRNPLDRRKK
jgi:hypothetical protein